MVSLFFVPINHHRIDQAVQFLAGAARYVLVRQGLGEVIDVGAVECGQVSGQHDWFGRQRGAFCTRIGQFCIDLVELCDDRRGIIPILDGLHQVHVPDLQLAHGLVVQTEHMLTLFLFGLRARQELRPKFRIGLVLHQSGFQT
ncbi:hypothetical protein [Oceaniglobus indicus]|uniref:hypothetical protein n=1 Tax=Oceaniglobus indicus TaxID=2047749 RepID=UPI001F4EEFC3|nr:hypothetical protein [Oceaniglobus indicus]